MLLAIVLGVLVVGLGPASADIYVYRDGEGVRHFTNVLEELPQSDRDAAVLVVTEREAAEGGEQAAALPRVSDAPPPEPRQAQIVYDQSALELAFAEGWRQGREVVQRLPAAAPASIEIRGPFVAAINNQPYEYPYARDPLITTSFDRGRSRHLTLRMLLQDQFALDRDGPFVFRERFLPRRHHVPVPVRLHPFLARGLPHVPAPRTRVLVR